MYGVESSKLFIEYIDQAPLEIVNLLEAKIALARQKPGRFKRIRHPYHLLFAIKFGEGRKNKRLIYLVEESSLHLLGVLDRDKEYNDLDKLLRVCGYK
jgi:hypothetical protein